MRWRKGKTVCTALSANEPNDLYGRITYPRRRWKRDFHRLTPVRPTTRADRCCGGNSSRWQKQRSKFAMTCIHPARAALRGVVVIPPLCALGSGRRQVTVSSQRSDAADRARSAAADPVRGICAWRVRRRGLPATPHSTDLHLDTQVALNRLSAAGRGAQRAPGGGFRRSRGEDTVAAGNCAEHSAIIIHLPRRERLRSSYP